MARRVNALEYQIKKHHDKNDLITHITYNVNKERPNLCRYLLSQKDTPLGREYIDALYDLLNSIDRVNVLEHKIEELNIKGVLTCLSTF